MDILWQKISLECKYKIGEEQFRIEEVERDYNGDERFWRVLNDRKRRYALF